MTYISSTDLVVRQLPSPIPAMGPVGSIVVDPAFNSKIIRATDENSIMLSGGPSAFNTAGVGGSADVNVWNTDSTMLYVEDSGGTGFILGFNPVTFAVARIFSSFSVTGGCIFSKVNPNIGFVLSGTQFLQYDFTNRTATAPPAPIVVCDFAAGLPGPMTWSTVGGVENLNTIFSAAFSVAGYQNTGVYACVYTVGSGYRIWNTQTGAVWGDWGPVGSVDLPNRFPLHNVKPNKGLGKYLVVTSAAPADAPSPLYVWEHATLDVRNLGSKAAGGHFCAGYGKIFNNDSAANIPYWSHVQRCLCDLTDPIRLANPSPAGGLMTSLDDHPSLNGPNSGVLMSVSCSPRAVGTTKPPFPAAWYDEVLGFDVTGSGVVWRFCHTFCSGDSGNFYADEAIGSGDQQNKFVAFTSDWMGTLLNKRADVFIVALQ